MRLAPILLTIGAALCLLVAIAAAALLAPDVAPAQLRAEYSQPEDRDIAVPGDIVLHIRDVGPRDAPALILLHGFASNLSAWDGWSAALKDRYRIISVDLPGHGLTQVPLTRAPDEAEQVALVGALADELGLPRFVLGGNSMGGAFAWRFASLYPQRVSALILVDAAGRNDPDTEQRFDRLGALSANPIFGFCLRWGGGPVVMARALRSGFADPSKVTPANIRRADRMYRAAGNRAVLLARLRGGFSHAAELTKLGAITAPTLLLYGDRDTFVSLAETEHLAAEIPGARLIRYRDLGHVPHEEDSGRTAADARAFLDGLKLN